MRKRGMRRDSTKEKLSDIGARLNSLIIRGITGVIVIVIFLGLAFLVYRGEVASDALLLYAGVIIGYLLHATKQAV